MAETKNVVFVGMTQNGKSSLIRQILLYAGGEALARTVAIGDSNISETQKCTTYNVKVPLKTHRLQQLEGPDSSRDGLYIIPGQDFNLDDADDYMFGFRVFDSGRHLNLRLIDTPGLSDSGNAQSSHSGMRVVDERHALRILLRLQKTEVVHAICFVVRRDTSYGGDFQSLVKRMVSLLNYTQPTTWIPQYHIIHTNIDVDDRARDFCVTRSSEFNKFGPQGAKHHFVDNKPDPDFPLDLYFADHSLSSLFESLAKDSGVDFKGLRYPKSSEQECNDQHLVSAAQRVVDGLLVDIKQREEELERLREMAQLYSAHSKRREESCLEIDEKVRDLSCGALVEIATQTGSTGYNIFGGQYTVKQFSFPDTGVPIADVKQSNDEYGDWADAKRSESSYQVTLQPKWLCTASGTVSVFCSKEDFNKTEISSLKERAQALKVACDEQNSKVKRGEEEIARLERQNDDTLGLIEALRQDIETVKQPQHSISLASNPCLVKFFTVDSPVAASIGYNLQTKLPWVVSTLDAPNIAIKSQISGKQEAATQLVTARKTIHAEISEDLDTTQKIKDKISHIQKTHVKPTTLLSEICQLLLSLDHQQPPTIVQDKGLAQAIQDLKRFVENWNSSASAHASTPLESGGSNDGMMDHLQTLAIQVQRAEESLLASQRAAFRNLQQAIWEEEATRLLLGYMEGESLPIGVLASLARGGPGSPEERYLRLLQELKDIEEVKQLVLDD